ncbi:hypothetical protein SNEBB_010781 [Seison nebaliae]|nr:hypothetical protein SNEBB_010781 [Seison nebaliae]
MSKPSSRNEFLYKLIVIGELATGKTSLIKRYVHNLFSQHYRSTIGVDFALKVVQKDNDIIRLQLWDIAGQERFGSMTRVYYRDAVGCVIVFDMTRASTFEAVIKWKADLDEKVQLQNGKPLPCLLLGNKCDLAKDDLVKNPVGMNQFCEDQNFIGWHQVSAKDGTNVSEAFDSLIDEIRERTGQTYVTGEKSSDIIKPEMHDEIKKKNGKCENC